MWRGTGMPAVTQRATLMSIWASVRAELPAVEANKMRGADRVAGDLREAQKTLEPRILRRWRGPT